MGLYGILRLGRCRSAQIKRAIELGLPIPGTGRRRRRYTSLRKPRHHGIYREVGRLRRTDAVEMDGVLVRGKLHHPPNNWDDLMSSAIGARNWKRFRRERWKA